MTEDHGNITKTVYLVSIDGKRATFYNDALILDHGTSTAEEARSFAINLSKSFAVDFKEIDLYKQYFPGQFSWQDVQKHIQDNLIKKISELDIEPPVLTQKNPGDSGSDYILDTTLGSAWIEVDNIVFYIVPYDDGVNISAFPTGHESGDELMSEYISFGYVASLTEQRELANMIIDNQESEDNPLPM